MGKKTIRTALILVLENHRCAWEQEAEVRLYKYMRSIHCLSQGDTPFILISISPLRLTKRTHIPPMASTTVIDV